MTSRGEPFERTLRSWMLAEASQDGAPAMHAAAIDAVGRRRQRRTWQVALRGVTWDGARGQARPVPRARTLIVIGALVATAMGVAVVGSGAFRSDRGMFVPPPSTSPSASSSTNPTSPPRATPRVDLPAPVPSRAPLSEAIVAYLVAHGQSVTPVPGAVPGEDVDAALRDVRPQGLGTQRYYAIVTCTDPSKGCAEVGSTGLGDERGIWFIYGNFVRAIDAVTLEHIPINGY
jgi:hypothetical protein